MNQAGISSYLLLCGVCLVPMLAGVGVTLAVQRLGLWINQKLVELKD